MRVAKPSLSFAIPAADRVPIKFERAHLEHWASAGRAHHRTTGLGTKPSPPTRTGRQLTFQARGFFTSRHGKVAQFQSLGHERVATLAFTLKVHPVTGGTDFHALLFHLKPGKLAFELRNARVQVIDVGPVTTW